MKKKTKRSIFDDRRIALVASLLIAVIAWVVVAGFINPGIVKVIQNVPIDYTYEDETYKGRGLQIVGDLSGVSYADVQIAVGDSARTVFSSNDVTVYPDYSSVRAPGVYELPLKASKARAGEDYTITDVSLRNSEYSMERNYKGTVTITFEEVVTKQLPVQVEAPDVTAVSGYFRGDPVATPPDITISGPKSEVDRITRVVAVISDDEELRDRKIYSGIPITLRDSAGHDIDTSSLSVSLSSETVEVDIPILESRTLNLGVEFIGAQQNFDMDWLMTRIHLSVDELQVVGDEAAFNNISDPYIIETFNLSQITLNWESDPITVELPQSLESLDTIRQVTASFDSSGLVEKTFEVENITVINSPVNAEIRPVADNVKVTLIGMEEQMDGLLPEKIVVQLDAAGISSSRGGQQTIPARILIPGANRVFASGEYSVVCDIVISS